MERLQELEYRLKDLENERRIAIEDYIVRVLGKKDKKEVPHLISIILFLKQEEVIGFLNALTISTKEDDYPVKTWEI